MKWIDPYMELYKIGSGDLTAYPVLRETAKKGKPMILSTGLSTEAEVLDAVSFIQDVNAIYSSPDQLAILQCTSMYPIQPSDANLKVMEQLKIKTGLTVGYSDHTEGSLALKYAVAMGAEVLEFHFTDSREGKVFRDHKVSLTPDEIADLIRSISMIKQLHGSSEKKPAEIEIENGHVTSFRRAVYPTRDIKAGEVLTSNDLVVLRPNHGIDAREYDALIGKKFKCDVMKSQSLSWDMLDK